MLKNKCRFSPFLMDTLHHSSFAIRYKHQTIVDLHEEDKIIISAKNNKEMENGKAYRNQIVRLNERVRQGDNHQCFMGKHQMSVFTQCFGVASFKLLKLKAKASVVQTFYEMDYHLAFTLFDFGFTYIC